MVDSAEVRELAVLIKIHMATGVLPFLLVNTYGYWGNLLCQRCSR